MYKLKKCTCDFCADFEEMLKRREHEFRTHADEMSAKVLEYELKV